MKTSLPRFAYTQRYHMIRGYCWADAVGESEDILAIYDRDASFRDALPDFIPKSDEHRRAGATPAVLT